MNMHFSKLWMCRLVLFGLVLLAPAEGLAVTRIFSNAFGDNEWFQPMNWQPNGDPADVDMLMVGGGHTPTTTQNVVTSDGGSITVSDEGTDPTFASLNVGLFGQGTLRIQSGAHVSGSFTTIGTATGAEGTVDVVGDGTIWDAGGLITVGSNGFGRMDVTEGAQVTTIAGVLADGVGGEAMVSISGFESSWILSQRLDVGYHGTASLMIDGATVSSIQGILGVVGTVSSGEVSVFGGGSWDVSGLLTVGGEGTGTLNIGPIGSVTSVLARVATSPGSNGTATLDGVGASWMNTALDDLLIGQFPSGSNDGEGSVNLSNGGTLTTGGGVTINDTGTLMLDGGALQAGALHAGANINVYGQLVGAGTIDGLVVNRGIIRPGAPGGTLVVNGGYQATPSGALVFEIGPQHGVLDVNSGLSLGGTLELGLADGFTPLSTDTFTVVQADSAIAAAFSNVADGGRLLLSAGGGGSFQVNYGTGGPLDVRLVILSNYQPGIAGDYNNDGTVNAADYTVYRNRKAGIGGTTLINEGVTPGVVTIEDYDFWKLHYGETIPGSGSSLADAAANVPEPASWILMFAALAGLSWSRGPRRQARPLFG